MKETGIIWTGSTWNPLSGCMKISAGCKFCYAETIANKFKKAFPNGFDLTLRPHMLNIPIKRKEPTLYFVNSMSDLFWDKVPNEYRHKVIDVMEQTPQHEYQVLTKRPEIMLKFSKERRLPRNFWAGTTIESQKVIERANIISEIDAEIKFISMEPMISPIHFDNDALDEIQWVITGGESGSHLWNKETCEDRALVYYDKAKKKWLPREDRIDWIREIRDFCVDRDVFFFHKQWGGSYPEAAGRMIDGKTWNEIPKLPANQTYIHNNYLKKIEAEVGNAYGEQADLFST